MVRRLFIVSMLLVLGLTIVNGAVLGIGNFRLPSQEMELVAAGFQQGCSDQPQPCWMGIIPGVTTVAEVEVILREAGYAPTLRPSFGSITYGRVEPVIPCSVHVSYNQSTGPIIRIQFAECRGLQLADFIHALGFADSVLPSDSRNMLRYQFHTELLLGSSLISPFSPISAFELRPNVMVQAAFGVGWKGFQPQGWYCQEQFGQDREYFC